MVSCLQCGRVFDPQAGDRPAASISGRIIGDVYIESYYLCPRCGFYTVEIVRDRFREEAEIFTRGPLRREEGDGIVERIRRCSDPSNVDCRCDAHQGYFMRDLD